MSKRILITDELHPLLQQGLETDGFTVDYRPTITEAEVHNIIHQYEGLVINSKVYAGKELLDKAVLLKFVCRAGSGLEVIDLPYAKEKNIAAFNSPEGNRNAVAEQALGMLLNLFNNITKANNEVHNYQWVREPNRGIELSGKTVALIAYGNTAQAFAKILRGFNVTVLAYDKYIKGFGDDFVNEASLQHIFDQADVVSLHLPLTAETTNMVDEAFLFSFKKPYWLLNTSRGKVLNAAALVKALDNGNVLGAALDVLENEKLNTLTQKQKADLDALLNKPNVLITPHIAGWTHESKQRIAEVLLEKIRKIYG
ncbi:MAG TPA: NAD(P)-dependent oxidoreductase [Chitinophagales bacterium]|nr:NAD(P)-dependent oxidoreductase [Chitinophagales bacterium]